MDLISYFIDLVLHLDKHLVALLNEVGALATYLVLFAVIFIETGLVIFPFLPGDSLLFAAGSLAALPDSPLNIFVLFILLAFAAVLGDSVNYAIGHAIGKRVYTEDIRFIKREYIDRTHNFYVAGVGEMSYGKFFSYNVLGGITWTALFLFGGYFFGNLKFVQDNFSFVIIAIIVISFVPVVFEAVQARRNRNKAPAQPENSKPE